MNENPGETPNPLNANPEVNLEANSNVPETNYNAPGMNNNMLETNGNALDANPTSVQSLDPTGRPMAQAAEITEPPKKKKTGLIVGIICGVLVLVGAVVAAVAVALSMQKTNAVVMAIQKIMNGEAPKNVAIDGDINILVNDTKSPIKRINIDLDSDIVTGSMINTSSAVLTFTNQSDQDYSVKFNEVYAAKGDLFFKIEGATAALEDSGIIEAFTTSNNQTTNCVSDESGNTNCETPVVEVVDCSGEEDCASVTETVETESAANQLLVNTILSVIEAADGVYLRVSTEDMELLTNGTLNSSPISCIANLVSDTNKNSNSAAELYAKYPFITSSDKNIIVTSKQNPVYLIGIDSKNLAGYISAIQNTEISEDVYSCLGLQQNVSVTEEDIAEIVDAIPAVYAEVNSENNFTRLYLESELGDGSATATIDLGISYPTNVNVTEPVEYTNFSDVIQTIFKGMYNLQDAETVNAN